MIKKRITLLHIPIDVLSPIEVLEKIKIYLSAPPRFVHIVSVNPENIVIAQQNPAFLSVYDHADLALTDGIGVVLGAKLLGLSSLTRVPGSILLPQLLDLAGSMSLRVVLIGSQANLAERIAKCYSQGYPKATFIGLLGYKNKLTPTSTEEKHIEDIVRAIRPHFVFVAFGSPYQELWIDAHKDLLNTSICMGVGGGFDYLSGATRRPPSFIRSIGLEWLYRLVFQPWRFGRQLNRLPMYIGLIGKEWIRCIMHPRE
jgi:N-acetylglucosaminyldiphosphoundecaprenol N-acetyl-beta-D-mannosaminyltransferase